VTQHRLVHHPWEACYDSFMDEIHPQLNYTLNGPLNPPSYFPPSLTKVTSNYLCRWVSIISKEWTLAIVKHEMNVVINLNIGRSQGLRGGVVFRAYSLGVGEILHL
jgi:hypothetical protein